jgi:hypothetical protein
MVDVSHIGTEVEPVTFPVERGRIRDYARAIREDNPIYFESKVPPAPLTFAHTFLAWGDNLLRTYDEIGIDRTRSLHGGIQFEYLQPLRAGDELTMTGKLADVYTKEGSRGGTLTFIIFDWVFTNQHGHVAVRVRNTTIQTDRAAAD